MTRSSQKEKEEGQLKKALSLLQIQEFEILPDHSERPDFIAIINGNKVGIEITEIHRTFGETNLARNQANIPKIINAAIAKYDKLDMPPLSFTVCVDGERDIPYRQNATEELYNFILTWISSRPQEDLNDRIEIELNKDTHKYLSFIRSIIAQKSQTPFSAGVTVTVFHSTTPKDDDLNAALRHKNAKASFYRKKCESIWLIVVLPQTVLCGDFRLPQRDMTIDCCHFDKVYILDDYRNEIKLLKSPTIGST